MLRYSRAGGFRATLVATALVHAAVAPASSLAQETESRSGFWAGGGLAGGWAHVSCDAPALSEGLCVGTEGKSAVGGMVRGGWWLSSKVRAGVEFRFIRFTAIGVQITPTTPPGLLPETTAGLLGSFLTASVFPWQAGGPYFSAGLGLTSLDANGPTFSFLDEGFGLTASAGYELNVGRRVRLVPEAWIYGGSVGTIPLGTSGATSLQGSGLESPLIEPGRNGGRANARDNRQRARGPGLRRRRDW